MTALAILITAAHHAPEAAEAVASAPANELMKRAASALVLGTICIGATAAGTWQAKERLETD